MGDKIKIKQAKKVILILLATLLASFCIVTLIGAISFTKQNPPQKDIEAAADVEIGSLEDLQNFAASVALGNSYEGQTVVLTDNIYCKNERIGIGYCNTMPPVTNNYFKGSVFDGQGFSIYNFQLTTARFYGGTADAFGLFSRIDSETTIRNLKLKTYQFTVEEIQKTSDYGQTTGGIVGYLAGGTIENCMVEDFTVNANYTASENNKMGVGGIFGVGWGTVNNCHVKGIKQTGVYRIAGIGPADCPYTVSHGAFGDAQLHVYYPNTPSTITNCVVQDVASATINYPIAKDKNAGTGRTFGSSGAPDDLETYEYEHSISTCQTSPGEPSVSSWSAAGGEFQSTIWYYGGPYFNDGYPCLRLYFSEYWCLIDFLIEPEGCGEIVGKTVENSTIQAEYSAAWNSIYAYKVLDLTSETLKICGQEITAEPSTGYEFDGWEIGDEVIFPEDYPDDWRIDTKQILIAKFKRASLYTLTFGNATGVESGVTISPKENGINVSGQSYTVYHGEQIKASPTSGDGPLTLKYTFNNSEGVECVVTYTIGEKYHLSDSKSPGTITEETTITPKVEKSIFAVTFRTSTGSRMYKNDNGIEESNSVSINMPYGTSIEYSYTKDNTGSEKILFEINGIPELTKITYKIRSNYKYQQATVNYINTNLTDLNISDEEYNFDIIGKANISVKNIQLCNLTFKTVEKASLINGEGEQVSSDISMRVESGTNITTTFDESNPKLLTYTVNGKTITYTADKYCAITSYTSLTEMPQDDVEIKPTVESYACEVTMQNISTDAKDGNRPMATILVEGDDYSIADDGIFVVEFGTTVDITNPAGTNIYIYTFSSGHKVTFTTTAAKYEIDSYDLDENGTLTSYSFDNTEEKQKVISPTFKVKTYKLTVESNIGEELENYEIYHGSTVTYSANLSLSDDSKFELTYNCIYNPFAKKTYKEKDYFLEYYKINDVANYLDDNENIVVKSDISIKLEFATFVTIEFKKPETGIASVSNIGTYNVRTGSGIIATKPEYPEKYLTYKITDQTRTIEVKYILEQYYTVEDSDISEFENGKIQTSKIITPIIKFNACTITMTKTDDSDIATMKVGEDIKTEYSFIVEYGTTIDFEAKSLGEGLFEYVYTFKYGNETVATITYKTENNQYAMSSEISGGNRKWHTQISSDHKTNDEIIKETYGTEETISPEFEKKFYDGNLA